jgi:DNA-directed RNA polymerase specialized sigma24 family protein
VTEDHRIVKQLRGIAARLTGDLDLQKDLMQEMFLHLVQVEADRPGQTLSWYLQGCQFRARDYLDRGRSINSIKRGNNLVPLDQGDDDGDGSLGAWPEAPDPIDLHNELITRDIVDLLVPQLTVMQQQILFLLMHGFGVCEVAREFRVSHPAIVRHRKGIARAASALLADSAGIGSRNASSSHSLVHTT